jgi:glycerol uptake facilitator-like aquaporin
MTPPAPWRRYLAEFLGTALLVTAVVGSGVMATRLSPGEVGLQLLENSTATALALGALILMFGPVSGAHFNPVVSAADWFLGRRAGTGLTASQLTGYALAQTSGAIAGSILANAMFALPAVEFSGRQRAAGHLWLAEVVATAGLVLLIFALARSGRAAVAPAPTAKELRTDMSDKPTVLFVCVHNAGRSQMAAGRLRHLAGDRVEGPCPVRRLLAELPAA